MNDVVDIDGQIVCFIVVRCLRVATDKCMYLSRNFRFKWAKSKKKMHAKNGFNETEIEQSV